MVQDHHHEFDHYHEDHFYVHYVYVGSYKGQGMMQRGTFSSFMAATSLAKVRDLHQKVGLQVIHNFKHSFQLVYKTAKSIQDLPFGR